MNRRRYIRKSIFTPEQLVRAYELSQLHFTASKIKTAIAFSGNASTIYVAVKTMRKYLQTNADTRNMGDVYQKAYRMIKDGAKVSDGFFKQPVKEESVKAPSADHFTNLEAAEKQFTKAIEEFISQEVIRRMTIKRLEYEKKVAEYEEKLKQLEDLVEEAKHSNWVQHIKKRFQNDL